MSEVRMYGGSEVRAERPEGASHLRLILGEHLCIRQAKIRRAFPLTEPSAYLSLQGADGKEVAMLRQLEGMEATSRALVEDDLDRRYFTPRIERIDMLQSEAGMWKFTVQTQRGPAEFFVRNWRDSAQEIAPDRWHIHSVDGGRFEIPVLSNLDARSLRFMDQLL